MDDIQNIRRLEAAIAFYEHADPLGSNPGIADLLAGARNELAQLLSAGASATQAALFDLAAPPAGTSRDKLDRYYTPHWATQALVDHLGTRLSGLVWDPCCGKDWGGAVLRKAPNVSGYIGSDIDPEATAGSWFRGEQDGLLASLRTVDFLRMPIDERVGAGDWIITNPPYAVGDLTAADFARHALSGEASVAMLLTLRWLEACRDRADILTGPSIASAGLMAPTDVYVVGRVQFIGSAKGNNLPSVWVVWDRQIRDPGTRMFWHPKDR